MKEEEYLVDRQINNGDLQSMKERMSWFAKVNEILETLPQYDCGACGFANCRSLAQGIVNGKVSIDACRVKKK